MIIMISINTNKTNGKTCIFLANSRKTRSHALPFPFPNRFPYLSQGKGVSPIPLPPSTSLVPPLFLPCSSLREVKGGKRRYRAGQGRNKGREDGTNALTGNGEVLLKNNKTLNKQLMLSLKKKPKTLIEFYGTPADMFSESCVPTIPYGNGKPTASTPLYGPYGPEVKDRFPYVSKEKAAFSELSTHKPFPSEGRNGPLIGKDQLFPNRTEGGTQKISLTNNSNLNTQKIVKEKIWLNKYIFNKFFICCKESRIESPTSFYGCFYIGPFDESLSQTLAHNIRRTLLSELSGLAITSVEIDGVSHKYSTIPGVKETALDLICNLQNIVFKKELNQKNLTLSKKTNGIVKKMADGAFQKMELIGYLRVRGPGVLLASDIQLPSGLECVNPNQYIATLAEDGCLNMKIYIKEGKNYIKQTPKSFDLTQLKQNTTLGGSSHSLRERERTSGAFKTSLSKQSLAASDWATPLEELTSTKSLFPAFGSGALPKGQKAQKTKTRHSNRIYLDSVFMPVTKANAIVQINDKCTDDLLENNLDFKLLKNNLSFVTPAGSSIVGGNSKRSKEPLSTEGKSSFSSSFNISNLNIVKEAYQERAAQSLTHHAPTRQNNKTFFRIKEQNLSNLFPDQTRLNPAILLTEKSKIQKGNARQCHIIVEIWTNGSMHPREALKNCLNFLASTFISLESVKMLGSMFKSDITYKKFL